ncbi:MAG: ECF transporter S component [candidate division Zixibacteria bacterium]|nr:ECF transporter S component [candidate division Zixibacteria bacterium]
MSHSQVTARVALFVALAYVLAYATAFIPNVSLIFIVFFSAGALYGLRVGLMVGGIGEFLWTVFNPFGMAPVTTTISQIAAMMIVASLGAIIYKSKIMNSFSVKGVILFSVFGLLSGFVFQLILNGVDAWLYGPFWEYLMAGLGFAVISIVSNAVIFPVFYPVIVKLAQKEYAR